MAVGLLVNLIKTC